MELQYTHVGDRILDRLKTLRMSQVELCRETGLSTTAVSSYCTGKRIPETAALHKLAKALSTSMEWILTGENRTNEDATKEEKLLPLPSCDGSTLDEDEADLVAMFRLLPPSHRDELFDLTYFKYKRYVEQKKESIYSTYFYESDDEESGPAGSHKPRNGTA